MRLKSAAALLWSPSWWDVRTRPLQRGRTCLCVWSTPMLNVTKKTAPTLCSAVKQFRSRESSNPAPSCASAQTEHSLVFTFKKNPQPFQGNHIGSCRGWDNGDKNGDGKSSMWKGCPALGFLSRPMRVKWLCGHLGNHFCRPSSSSSSSNLAGKRVAFVNQSHPLRLCRGEKKGEIEENLKYVCTCEQFKCLLFHPVLLLFTLIHTK